MKLSIAAFAAVCLAVCVSPAKADEPSGFVLNTTIISTPNSVSTSQAYVPIPYPTLEKCNTAAEAWKKAFEPTRKNLVDQGRPVNAVAICVPVFKEASDFLRDSVQKPHDDRVFDKMKAQHPDTAP